MSESTKLLSCSETAKIIRKALNCTFPGHKFSVRSRSYAGGASIDINWTDGPTTKEVEAITHQFESRGFDGMIDLAYSIKHWLLPDGTTKIAYSEGTSGSGGVYHPIQNEKPHPKAILIRFGSNYIIEQRAISPARLAEAIEIVAQKYGFEQKPQVAISDYDSSGYLTGEAMYQRFGHSSFDFRDLIHQEVNQISFYTK